MRGRGGVGLLVANFCPGETLNFVLLQNILELIFVVVPCISDD